MIYLELFWAFFQIGLFTFGGGYAALALIQEQVVYENSWLTLTTFADIITISQMTPGPISINIATFVGMQLAGTAGAIIATLGCIAPACFIVTLLAYLYYRYRQLNVIKNTLEGLRPAVVALIASAGLSILILAIWGTDGIDLANTNIAYVIIFIICVAILRSKRKISPVVVMCGAGAVGLLL